MFQLVENFSNMEVRQTFSRVTEWKKEISNFIESKARFDKDVFGVELEKTKIDELKLKYNELIKSFIQTQADVDKTDKEQAIYLSHKLVKELCVYLDYIYMLVRSGRYCSETKAAKFCVKE